MKNIDKMQIDFAAMIFNMNSKAFYEFCSKLESQGIEIPETIFSCKCCRKQYGECSFYTDKSDIGEFIKGLAECEERFLRYCEEDDEEVANNLCNF